jgi:hypothetical protein
MEKLKDVDLKEFKKFISDFLSLYFEEISGVMRLATSNCLDVINYLQR